MEEEQGRKGQAQRCPTTEERALRPKLSLNKKRKRREDVGVKISTEKSVGERGNKTSFGA